MHRQPFHRIERFDINHIEFQFEGVSLQSPDNVGWRSVELRLGRFQYQVDHAGVVLLNKHVNGLNEFNVLNLLLISVYLQYIDVKYRTKLTNKNT